MNPTSLLNGLGAAITAEPTLGGAGTATTAPGTGDLFLALVAGLLQDGATAGGAPAVPGEAVAAEPEATSDEQAADTGQATDAALAALAALVVPAATAAAPQPAAPGVSAAGEGSTVAAAGAIATDAAAASAAGAGEEGTSRDGGPGGQAAAAAAEIPQAAAPTADGPGDVARPTPARTDAAASVAAPAPVSAAPTSTAAPNAPAGDVHRVGSQVFPEVVRVATSGVEGGTQRVTVKLNPESLGEVRVVLTHRNGELEVSLAGGEDARRALTEGTSELRRLLEAVGRADSRIVIRDLPSATTTATTVVQDGSAAARTDVSTDLGGNAWSGAGRPGGESAAEQETTTFRTPGSSTATDGTPDATILSRSTTTDASGRPGGLDVSI